MASGLFRCDSCRHHWSDAVILGPVLRDATWHRLARKHETLCGDCVFQRAADRGVTLTIADLKPCRFNESDNPSWFDRFGGEQELQALINANKRKPAENKCELARLPRGAGKD